MISAASDSGCIAVNIGMESGNPTILRQIRKPGTVQTFLKAAEIFRKFPNIHASVLLMVGFPGETFAMVQDTIDVAKQMDLDWYRITPLIPLPNTPIYDSMVAEGLIRPEETDPSRSVIPKAGGPNASQVKIEQSQERLDTISFNELFAHRNRDDVPHDSQITDIWFYMNYHLNFSRLLSESREIKVSQQLKNLNNLSDVVSPENGFALYYSVLLEHRITGKVNTSRLSRLHTCLETSLYWKDRLATFNIDVDRLTSLS
jgi:hypothetical protein